MFLDDGMSNFDVRLICWMKIKYGFCCYMIFDLFDFDDNSCGWVICSGLIFFLWSCKGGEEGREFSNILVDFGFFVCMVIEICCVLSLC